MDCQTARHTLRVVNSQGLHMRPCAAIAGLLARFRCDVKIMREDRTANGKSTLDLMMLAAPQGAELAVEATGADCGEAVAALLALWETLSKEESESPSAPA